MKILLSSERLANVNTFKDCYPATIQVLDSKKDVLVFLDFTTKTSGYSSVAAYLAANPLYMYQLPVEVDLKELLS